VRKYGDPPPPRRRAGPEAAGQLRGKRGPERRLGARLDADALDRLLAERELKPEVDFDIADAEASVEDARREAADGAPDGSRESPEAAADGGAPRPVAVPIPPQPAPSPAGARRVPDLAALPPLLAATGSFAAPRASRRPGGSAPPERPARRPHCGTPRGEVVPRRRARPYRLG
jgi:hypothetical protein